MSLRDDSILRDKFGRIVKGSGGLHRKQEQEPPLPPDPDATFDSDLIEAANSFGRARTKTGRRAWCEELRDERPVEFAALLRPALARVAESQAAIATGQAGVKVIAIGSIPQDCYVQGDVMRLMYADLTGSTPADEPPAKPTLVVDEPFAGADNVIEFGAPDDDE